MIDQNEEICCICGRRKNEVGMLYIGTDGCICSECIEQLHYMNQSIDATKRGEINNLDLSDKDLSDDYVVEFGLNVPKPHEIKDFLDQYVIGQDEAKRTLAVAIYNHYKRIKNRTPQNEDDDVELQKSNILLCGASGAGKSYLVQNISKMLDIPFVSVDATVFTEAGYVGEDVESILSRLYQNSGYNVAKTEIGIVYIDECDKLGTKKANPSITRDVNGSGVQQALLKIIEGTDVLVPPEGGRKHPDAKMVKINTNNILFICGGAFVGIEDMIASRLNTNSIGFALNAEEGQEKIEKDDMIRYVEPNDIRKYGFIPEIVGRLPIITYVEKLDKEALKRILVEPKNSIVKQYQKLFRLDGVDLHFSEEALDYIVEEAEKNETGARGLRSIVEKIMKDYMFDVPSDPDIHEIVIDAEYIKKIDPKYKVA